MKRVGWGSVLRRRWVLTGAIAALGLGSWAAIGSAQPGPVGSAQASQGATHQTADQAAVTKQLDELRAQVARLQAALERQQQQPASPTAGMPAAPPAGAPSSSGMGQMGMRMGEMGMRMGMSEMGSMPPGGEMGGMGMMDMHKGEMGMPPEGMRMGEMGGMATPSAAPTAPTTGGGMQMGSGSSGTRSGGPAAARPGRSTSALPGVPGASHLYHIGSTGFFLDQPRITLTTEQQTALNRIKERAVLERSTAERKIEQAEQELWALTGADQPEAARVEAKLKEVEQLRTIQRMAFIRAVGEASNVLTAEQRNVVLGTGMPKK